MLAAHYGRFGGMIILSTCLCEHDETTLNSIRPQMVNIHVVICHPHMIRITRDVSLSILDGWQSINPWHFMNVIFIKGNLHILGGIWQEYHRLKSRRCLRRGLWQVSWGFLRNVWGRAIENQLYGNGTGQIGKTNGLMTRWLGCFVGCWEGRRSLLRPKPSGPFFENFAP